MQIFTTQQAADILNVSLEYVRVKLESGELFSTCEEDVLRYANRLETQSRKALDDLAEQAQRLDMGYDD